MTADVFLRVIACEGTSGVPNTLRTVERGSFDPMVSRDLLQSEEYETTERGVKVFKVRISRYTFKPRSIARPTYVATPSPLKDVVDKPLTCATQ